MFRLYKAAIIRPYVHRKPELLVEVQSHQELCHELFIVYPYDLG